MSPLLCAGIGVTRPSSVLAGQVDGSRVRIEALSGHLFEHSVLGCWLRASPSMGLRARRGWGQSDPACLGAGSIHVALGPLPSLTEVPKPLFSPSLWPCTFSLKWISRSKAGAGAGEVETQARAVSLGPYAQRGSTWGPTC